MIVMVYLDPPHDPQVKSEVIVRGDRWNPLDAWTGQKRRESTGKGGKKWLILR